MPKTDVSVKWVTIPGVDSEVRVHQFLIPAYALEESHARSKIASQIMKWHKASLQDPDFPFNACDAVEVLVAIDMTRALPT